MPLLLAVILGLFFAGASLALVLREFDLRMVLSLEGLRAALVPLGLLGLLSVARLRRGEVGARWTPVLVGAAYVLFAVGAFAYRGLRVHFLGFLILGLLYVLGGIAWPEKAE